MQSRNAALEPLIDSISYHRYDAPQPTTTEIAAILTAAAAHNHPTSMMEMIGATHLTLYDDLIFGHNSRWEQFTVAFPYTGATDNGEAYFQVNTSTWAVTLGTRTKYLRHYARYIRPGAIMKGVTNSSGNFAGVPFMNRNGRYVVPIKCTTSGTIDVVGLPAGTYEIRYTTGNGTSAPSAYDQVITSQTITSGQNVSFTMPGAGVVTVFDTNFMVAGGQSGMFFAAG